MLALRLPEEIEIRLEKLAKSTGRTKSFYAREAIIEHLADLEYLYLAEKRLEKSSNWKIQAGQPERCGGRAWLGKLNSMSLQKKS
jgi:RHH-type transcriptional regulator, rel operon repressor / antitoxin RelB